MQAKRRHRYSVCCFLLHAIGHVDSGTVKQKDIKKQPLLITKKHLSNGKKCLLLHLSLLVFWYPFLQNCHVFVSLVFSWSLCVCLSGSFNCLVGNVDVSTFINILKGPRLLQQLLSLHWFWYINTFVLMSLIVWLNQTPIFGHLCIVFMDLVYVKPWPGLTFDERILTLRHLIIKTVVYWVYH